MACYESYYELPLFPTSPDEWQEEWMPPRTRCWYCGSAESPMNTLTDDHVYPTSKGGSNHYANMRRACMGCNGAKRDSLLSDFIASRIDKCFDELRKSVKSWGIRYAAWKRRHSKLDKMHQMGYLVGPPMPEYRFLVTESTMASVGGLFWMGRFTFPGRGIMSERIRTCCGWDVLTSLVPFPELFSKSIVTSLLAEMCHVSLDGPHPENMYLCGASDNSLEAYARDDNGETLFDRTFRSPADRIERKKEEVRECENTAIACDCDESKVTKVAIATRRLESLIRDVRGIYPLRVTEDMEDLLLT